MIWWRGMFIEFLPLFIFQFCLLFFLSYSFTVKKLFYTKYFILTFSIDVVFPLSDYHFKHKLSCRSTAIKTANLQSHENAFDELVNPFPAGKSGASGDRSHLFPMIPLVFQDVVIEFCACQRSIDVTWEWRLVSYKVDEALYVYLWITLHRISHHQNFLIPDLTNRTKGKNI